jgi:hypothetical protein
MSEETDAAYFAAEAECRKARLRAEARVPQPPTVMSSTEKPSKPVTWKALTKFMPKLAHAVSDSIREHSKPRDAKIAALEATLAKSQADLVSAERRLSRHADHLARLESRMKAMETR